MDEDTVLAWSHGDDDDLLGGSGSFGCGLVGSRMVVESKEGIWNCGDDCIETYFLTFEELQSGLYVPDDCASRK